ncbi:Gfo/Idh/MocA family protein [Microlunatus speluncae]|uniref:Gfo/Idh/MocA family protein n=1 Tax=Microlunatus speluncae TaxID=2594267 RepID=UPI0013754BEA|nr:Gfo/Idh/MocA family oxidoreductase [Microlunatus speluncae]
MNDHEAAPLRLGIVGAGALASRRIYPWLSRLPVELTAVCELDPGRGAAAAQQFGAKSVYTDHTAMFAEAGLDAVIVCVDPEAHARLATEAMRAGLPVYTEKPPAVTAEAAEEVARVSRETGVSCMTGFKKRFAPAYAKLRQAIADGTMGEPSLLSIDYASGAYANDQDRPRSQFLLDFAVHIIDLSRFLFGEVAGVYARSPEPSTYAVNLGYRSGAVGTLALSAHRDWGVSTEKVEITGGPGQFASVQNSITMVRHSGREIADWHDPSFSTAGGDSMIETGFAGELTEFVTAVREQREPESSIHSSSRTMRLYQSIAESAASGSVITIEEPA